MEEKRVPLSLMNVFPLRNFKMKFKGISITHGHGERWVRLRLCFPFFCMFTNIAYKFHGPINPMVGQPVTKKE